MNHVRFLVICANVFIGVFVYTRMYLLYECVRLGSGMQGLVLTSAGKSEIYGNRTQYHKISFQYTVLQISVQSGETAHW